MSVTKNFIWSQKGDFRWLCVSVSPHRCYSSVLCIRAHSHSHTALSRDDTPPCPGTAHISTYNLVHTILWDTLYQQIKMWFRTLITSIKTKVQRGQVGLVTDSLLLYYIFFNLKWQYIFLLKYLQTDLFTWYVIFLKENRYPLPCNKVQIWKIWRIKREILKGGLTCF